MINLCRQRIILVTCLLCTFLGKGAALFEKSKVRHLSADQYNSLKKSGKPFLVKFFSEGCGHCKSFAPEYEKAAELLQDILQVIAVDDPAAMQAEQIEGYPTVKFMYDKTNAVEFKENRTAKSLADFALRQFRAMVDMRSGSKGKGGKANSGTGASGSKGKGGKANSGTGASSDKDVIVLTDANFESKLGKEFADSVWLVEFYAPWCGHCKSLEPTWNSVATQLKGEVKVAKVDATKNEMLAKHFGIEGFPTLMLFPPGGDRSWNKLPSRVLLHTESRAEKDILAFARAHAGAATKVVQLTSQSQLEEKCGTGVCIISFLPHILDSGAAERNANLEIINKIIPTTFALPVKFLWSEGGAQFDMEESLRLQFGFPAVVAINLEKNKFGVHKGQFQEDALRSFVTGLMAGRVSVDSLPPALPKLKTVAEWDGKDAPMPEPEPEESEDDEL